MSENNIVPHEITPEEAREILWRRGNLEFKLDPNQLEMVRSYKNSHTRTVVWNCSRQLGKSYTLCVVAIEKCLQQKNAIVKLLAPTTKMMRTILRPHMRQLTADAPDDLKPEEKVGENVWVFPSTGSQIQLAGCDGGRADNVRGTKADLCIIDEAGFVDKDLSYIVNSVILPLTTTTKGKIILASTPPPSPDHDFVGFLNKARYEKAAIEKTIFDNPRLTRVDIDELAKAQGGYESIGFRREYLAQIIKDDTKSIVPEFDQDLKEKIVKEWPRPAFYDTYVSMDVGLKDLTVVLFGYFDFKANKLIIEDEFVINGQKLTTKALAEGIKAKEDKNFSDPFTKEVKDPHIRVSDNNLILIQDLYREHSLYFIPTKKDDADAALHDMRTKIKDQMIIIHPRCETLVRHLENGVWNNKKTSFARTDVDGSHFDAIDSLKYMVRNVDFHKNPYPPGWGQMSGRNIFHKTPPELTRNSNAWNRIMNIKK